MRQSERLTAYREAMEQLLATGLVYPCTCSRKDLHEALQAPHEHSDDEPVYNGRCRPEVLVRASSLHAETNYRFRVPDEVPIKFVDGNFGAQRFIPGCTTGADFGDFLVWRRDGLPSYQLACVVDDAAMAATEVVRGRDLLKSTARQILLQRALALATPACFHTELFRDERGERLAKRHDALSLRALRASGVTPYELRERVRARLHQNDL